MEVPQPSPYCESNNERVYSRIQVSHCTGKISSVWNVFHYVDMHFIIKLQASRYAHGMISRTYWNFYCFESGQHGMLIYLVRRQNLCRSKSMPWSTYSTCTMVIDDKTLIDRREIGSMLDQNLVDTLEFYSRIGLGQPSMKNKASCTALHRSERVARIRRPSGSAQQLVDKPGHFFFTQPRHIQN
jgi:hypothetical protein